MTQAARDAGYDVATFDQLGRAAAAINKILIDRCPLYGTVGGGCASLSPLLNFTANMILIRATTRGVDARPVGFAQDDLG
jgi:hypothetical protein